MHPILFSIGKVNFYSYGLMAALAFLSTVSIIIHLTKKNNFYTPNLLDKLILIFLAGLISARLSYFIIYYQQFKHWYEIIIPWQGAMTSFGGIIGVLASSAYFFRKEIYKWFDVIAVSFPIGLFFWRIGCFLAGDHPQVDSNVFFAIRGEFPAILIESLMGLLGFMIFYFFYNRFESIKGLTFFSVMTYYGLLRIYVDHFRIDPMMWGLKTGQMTGIIFAIIGIIGIILVVDRKIKGRNKYA